MQTAKTWTAGVISANWKSFEDLSKHQENDIDPKKIVDTICSYKLGKITDTECSIEIKAYMTGKDSNSMKTESNDLESLIIGYLDSNPDLIEDYRKNEKAINKLIGSIMRQTGGAYSSSDVVDTAKRLLQERL